MKKLLLVVLISCCTGITLRAVIEKAMWHSHVSHVCEWNGPSRGLDRGAWTHRDPGLTKDKTKEQKEKRCKELGFRPKF